MRQHDLIQDILLPTCQYKQALVSFLDVKLVYLVFFQCFNSSYFSHL